MKIGRCEEFLSNTTVSSVSPSSKSPHIGCSMLQFGFSSSQLYQYEKFLRFVDCGLSKSVLLIFVTI